MVGAPGGGSSRPTTAGWAPSTWRILVRIPAASRMSRVASAERRTFSGSNPSKLTEGILTSRSRFWRTDGIDEAIACWSEWRSGTLALEPACQPGDLRDRSVPEPSAGEELLQEAARPWPGHDRDHHVDPGSGDADVADRPEPGCRHEVSPLGGAAAGLAHARLGRHVVARREPPAGEVRRPVQQDLPGLRPAVPVRDQRPNQGGTSGQVVVVRRDPLPPD